MARVLIELGADINVKGDRDVHPDSLNTDTSSDRWGQTAIEYAAERGYLLTCSRDLAERDAEVEGEN